MFRDQIKIGGPITVTHTDITRYFMTIPEAAQLVIQAGAMAKGGEVFVTKMPVARIADLADVMVRELAPKFGLQPEEIEVRCIGTKAGEKLYEELLSEEEMRRTLELQDFFAILPAFKSVYRSIEYQYEGVIAESVDRPYNSRLEQVMSIGELADYLRANNTLMGEN